MISGDTIAALATGAAQAGVAIVRISGPCALDCARRLATLPDPLPARSAVYAAVRHPAGGGFIDRAIFLYFPAPASFTGEDVVEVQGHGGVLQAKALLEAVLCAGARAAEAGEFSRRAVLNGRMSLEQAEALCDVVAAETDAGLKAARAQLFGALGSRVEALLEEGRSLQAELEAALDFPDEVDPPADVAGRAGALSAACERLAATHRAGRALREGARVVLAGAPNAGKSSLFNALLGEGRALVHAEPGTTRDALEARVDIAGVACTLVDTAGLRDGAGEVERLGIARAQAEIARGSVCVWVVDATTPVEPPDDGRDYLRVVNKCDLVEGPGPDSGEIRTSALLGQGLGALREELARRILGDRGLSGAEVLVTHSRHAEALREAARTFGRVAGNARSSPLEILAYDVGEAVSALGRILGRGVDDALLDEIFARFCVGK